MFDTHCHLNFKSFKKNLNQVIDKAKKAGVKNFVVPGTDYKTSEKAVQIADKHPNLYVAVGIHPHHVFKIKNKAQPQIKKPKPLGHNLWSQFQRLFKIKHPDHLKKIKIGYETKKLIKKIENLLDNKKVVAIGEVGLDYHLYKNTKYEDYQINKSFINHQKILFENQINLAKKYKKSLILHNREATPDLLKIIEKNWGKNLSGKTVFHCCQPDNDLLSFAIKNHVYIGVDGDITYSKEKQVFIKKVPLDLLVVETDSPFLLPEPLRSQKKYPNQPSNLLITINFISKMLKLSKKELISFTEKNSHQLFNIKP